LWLAVVLALGALVVVWGARIGASFHGIEDAAPSPVPVATAAPQIATVYSNLGPPDPATLCAELSPVPKQVTVESTTGALVATITCHS
jgi:hypothetical protein